MPSQRVDDHAQKENRDCNAIIEEVDALDYGDDFGSYVEKKSEKPWYVRCDEANYSASFKSLRSASKKFMEKASGLDSKGPPAD